MLSKRYRATEVDRRTWLHVWNLWCFLEFNILFLLWTIVLHYLRLSKGGSYLTSDGLYYYFFFDVSIEHLQRMWQCDTGYLVLWTSFPVPFLELAFCSFRTSVVGICYDTHVHVQVRNKKWLLNVHTNINKISFSSKSLIQNTYWRNR